MGVQFKKGQSGNPNGRPKGTKNKVRFDVAQILKENKCNPFEILAYIATGNTKKLELTVDQEKYFSIRLRMEAAAELAQYIAPKLKSVELSTDQENPVQVNFSFGKQNGN